MSRWIDQFNNHPFHAIWASMKDAINSIEVESFADDTGVKEYARYQKLMNYLDELIKGIDPDFFVFSNLAIMQQQANAAVAEINQFSGNKNIGHLQNANNNLDQILLSINNGGLSIPPSSIKSGLTKAATAYNTVLDEHLLEVKNNTDNIVSELQTKIDKMSVRLEAQDVQLIKAQSELDTTQNTIQLQTAEFQTQFNTDQKDRDGKFTADQDERQDEFDGITTAHQEKINEEFVKLAQKSSMTLEVLSRLQGDAEKVYNVVVNTVQAGAYATYADKEKTSANGFRWAAIITMVFAITIVVGPELYQLLTVDTYTFVWEKTLGRASLSFIILVLGFYLANQSKSHRENEFKNRRRELILTTLDPYLALLDKVEDRDEIKKAVAKSIFADTPSPQTQVDEGNVLSQLSNLVKQFSKTNNK